MSRLRWLGGLAGAFVLGAVALAASGGALAAWVVSDGDRLQALVDRLLDGSGLSVDVSESDVLEGRLYVGALSLKSQHTVVTARGVDAAVPGIWAAVGLGRVRLGDVHVDRLSVDVLARPGRKQARSALGLPLVLVVDRLTVTHGRLMLAKDGPLPEAGADDVDVVVSGLRVALGQGPRAGRGTVSAASWRTGPVVLNDVQVGDLRLAPSAVTFGDGHFSVGGGRGDAKVVLGALDQPRPSLSVDARVSGVALSTLVSAATGKASPVSGRVAGTVRVRGGGPQDRGDGETVAELTLTEGAVQLGEGLGRGARAVLKAVPWVTVRSGAVRLGPTEATLRLVSGRVDVDRLVHVGDDGRKIAARGAIDGRDLDLVVRFVPKRGAERRKGLGLHLQGRPGAMTVVRATAEQLEGLE